MAPDEDTCYRAVLARDARFDSRVFTAVLTTGVYCRPSCPSRTPLRHNVRFYPSSAAAVAAGFRACKRCRPDALAGSRAWDHRADLVARALRLIAAGEVDEHGVRGLAGRLSVSERHVHRTLVAEVGVGPLALARTRRAQTARLLVDQTQLSMTEVAFAAGFASVRQFNDVMRAEFGVPPSQLRTGTAPPAVSSAGGGVSLRLVHREPYAAGPLLGFLAARAVPGVEQDTDSGLCRVLPTRHGPAVADLRVEAGHVNVRLHLDDLSELGAAVAGLRRLMDSDADPAAIDAVLASDPTMAPLVQRSPGLRVPGAVDGFELAVRAILGQQVSVAGARTLAHRLVLALGEPLDLEQAVAPALTHAFPRPAAVAEADLSGMGLTSMRAQALRALAGAVAAGELMLDPGADRQQVRSQLGALPGIGAWTVEYIAMRALADPDAWPGSDLVLRREVAATGADPDRWRPWRAYGALHLWNHSGQPAATGPARPAAERGAGDRPATGDHAERDRRPDHKPDQHDADRHDADHCEELR
jgi:AraC family transcriptional regulator, regulatory protein of adaptative response / DNA-3-methyladenine glycosylase II